MPDDPVRRLAATYEFAVARRRAIAGLVLASVAVGVVRALLLPPRYTAQTSFFPESRTPTDITSGLGGLASLVGTAGGPLSLGQPSTVFFTDLFKSRSFLDSLASSTVMVDSAGHAARVAEYLVPKAGNPGQRRWKARQAVQKILRVSTLPSGVVVLRVTGRSPYAAASIADRAIAIIDDLNIEFRRRQAAARRRFTQQFLDDVEHRLNQAEDRLEQFLLSNRLIVGPALQRRQQALTAEVARLRSLKEQLGSSIETARLTEYNDAPLVARVDSASVPEQRSGPSRSLVAVGVVLATLLAIFWAIYLRLWRL